MLAISSQSSGTDKIKPSWRPHVAYADLQILACFMWAISITCSLLWEKQDGINTVRDIPKGLVILLDTHLAFQNDCFDVQYGLKQWFSNLSVHQNLLEGLLKYTLNCLYFQRFGFRVEPKNLHFKYMPRWCSWTGVHLLRSCYRLNCVPRKSYVEVLATLYLKMWPYVEIGSL